MSNTFSGHYPIEHRAGEIERLLTQSKAMVPSTLVMLERIRPTQGWTCLDIGCGPGGITDLLSARVGPSGRVIGLDRDPGFLEHARKSAAANTEFREGDAYGSDLPAGAFDLVHMRFVASTAGDPERLLKEAVRLARPGGIVALQELDASTLRCYPPHPAWDQLKDALIGAFNGVGAELELARLLYHFVHQAGLRDVQYRTALLGVRSTDPMVDYLPSTVESLRGTILRLGLLGASDLDTALADCRAHLGKPGTSSCAGRYRPI